MVLADIRRIGVRSSCSVSCRPRPGCVVFIEELRVLGEVLHEEPLYLVVPLGPGNEPMSGQDPLRVCIHHENGMPPSVEHDGVRCFRPDAIHRKETFAQFCRVFPEHPLEAPAVMFCQEGHQVGEAFRLDIVIAARTDEVSNLSGSQPTKRGNAERPRAFEVDNGLFHVGPRCVLGKDCSHHHLKGGVAGPPVLRTVLPEKDAVNDR